MRYFRLKTLHAYTGRDLKKTQTCNQFLELIIYLINHPLSLHESDAHKRISQKKMKKQDSCLKLLVAKSLSGPQYLTDHKVKLIVHISLRPLKSK